MNSAEYVPDEEETEIDLISVLKKIVLQWRAIVVFSLILAVLVSGAMYYKDYSEVKSAKEYESVLKKRYEKKELRTKLRSQMTTEEKDEVKNAVLQKRRIDNLQTYIDNSVYMKVDAMNCKTLELMYYIKADKGSDAGDLLAVYREMLNEDDSVDAIREAAGVKVAAKYIRELISVYDAKSSDNVMTADTSTDIMGIDFILPPDADSAAISRAIDKLVRHYDTSDLGIASGTVTKISSDVNLEMDSDVQSKQDSYNNNLKDQKSAYRSTVDAFSDEQKQLLDLDLYDIGHFSQDDIIEAEFSKKYPVIGFAVGIVLWIVFALIYEMLRRQVSSVSGNSSEELGRVYDSNKKKSNALMCDKILEKRLYKKEMDVSRSLERIMTQLLMKSDKDNLTSFEIWSVGFDAVDSDIVSQIRAEAAKYDIAVSVKATEDGNPDVMISETEKDKSVALLLKDGTSRKKDVAFLTDMLYNRKCDYLGYIELI